MLQDAAKTLGESLSRPEPNVVYRIQSISFYQILLIFVH